MGRLDWHGDKFTPRFEAELKRRISRSCLLVVNHAKQLINVDGTKNITSGKTRDKSGKILKGSGKKKLVYGANPSQPGDPPHKQTGRLLGSVAWEVVDLVGRVGTNLDYGRWLELGTRLMKARPWLRRALKECRDRIIAIISAPMDF